MHGIRTDAKTSPVLFCSCQRPIAHAHLEFRDIYRKLAWLECVVADKRAAVAELAHLEDACASRDKATVHRQLEINPKARLPSLFASGIDAERARMALKHVFPSIVFLGKRDRFCSEFAIECAPGVLLAELSETRVIDPEVA